MARATKKMLKTKVDPIMSLKTNEEKILIEADPIISVKIDSLFCNSHYVYETK